MSDISREKAASDFVGFFLQISYLTYSQLVEGKWCFDSPISTVSKGHTL